MVHQRLGAMVPATDTNSILIKNRGEIMGVGFANVIHMLLEAQEYYTDVFFGTHNVRGTFDVVNDLLVGVLGTIVYGLLYLYFFKRHQR